jgi:hypothetical protein
MMPKSIDTEKKAHSDMALKNSMPVFQGFGEKKTDSERNEMEREGTGRDRMARERGPDTVTRATSNLLLEYQDGGWDM